METGAKMDSAMDPKTYRRMLEHVHLEKIALEECNAVLRRDKLSDEIDIMIDDKKSHDMASEKQLFVRHEYKLVAYPKGARAFVLNVKCTYLLVYSCEAELTEAFLDAFVDHNIPLNSWPYFREFVQNLTQRMNVPPLTLPLLKS